MKPLKVGHVVLKVRELERAAAFYVQALGFEEVNRLDRPKAIFLTLGKQHHDIALFEFPDLPPPGTAQGGLHHVALKVANIEVLKEGHAQLKRHKVEILRAVDHGTTNSVYFCDPDGNGLELYCDIGTDGLARARRRTARTADDFPPLELDR